MKFTYTNIEDLPLTLKAHEAAAVLRISKSKVYELAQSESFHDNGHQLWIWR